MASATPQTTRLADYRPPAWLIDEVHLTLRLHPFRTRVKSRIAFRPNPATTDRQFRLDGEKLTLMAAAIDGVAITPDLSDAGLSANVPDKPFIWEAEVEIDPSGNTALEGLYLSNGIYCTQCEAEGFRRITYYPDRPDVMAPFTVRIEAGDTGLPVLLSNGNPVASGDGWAEWHDPWPKPSYLFALVAGDLQAISAPFTTSEGRDVTLNIWVRPDDANRTHYALESLIAAMRWDERVYGRAYDLDVFNIVAVGDFNAGAMENKGLNIFNSKYVLASPDTATDGDFEGIESVVAHEYFHNWTGNRITCRDWFQLCLKEGLTVYRDQEFTSDMRSRPVKRIADALLLRSAQFREDNGPLSHPARPDHYVEINNFYTATVYEKGAEIVRMLARIVGEEAFRKGMEIYFDRYDGSAATIEDFFGCFRDASPLSLDGFETWWTQAGTPRVTVARHWDGDSLTLSFRQKTPPTTGQETKAPVWIPLATGVLDRDGAELGPTHLIVLKASEEHWRFERQSQTWNPVAKAPDGPHTPGGPIPSINRGFSAPVVVDAGLGPDALRHLLSFDSDPFQRWDAARQLSRDCLIDAILNAGTPDDGYIAAMGWLLRDDTLDPAFRALVFTLPSQDDLAQTLAEARHTPDPDRIFHARREVLRAIAAHLAEDFRSHYQAMATPGPYSPDAVAAARRSLRTTALGYLSWVEGPDRASELYRDAENMTERLAALGCLVQLDAAERELAMFHATWRHVPDVLDKWFSLQVGLADGATAVERARALVDHPDFDWRVPNRVRSVVGALLRNHAGFHTADGSGYAAVADWIMRLDPQNPQIAAGLTGGFQTWRRYDGDRQGMMRDALKRIGAASGLSRDTREMVDRILDV